MATIPATEKTEALYQKDGTLIEHTSTISSITPLSSLPSETQALFKSQSEGELFVLTTPSTIFHAQGGGQPSDTGTIILVKPKADGEDGTFKVDLVRKSDPSILHMGTFLPETSRFEPGDAITQNVDVDARRLNSKLHTAGHVLGLALRMLSAEGELDKDLMEVKASHYPGAAFVEFRGLIQGTSKQAIQDRVDKLVAKDLPVNIHFWSEEEAKQKCTVVLENVKGDEDGVRVVEIGSGDEALGSYPCGGTHVQTLKELGKIVVRNIKRQKGISKISYEVVRAES
jgi:Ser-tRNA(Ala) deacylase AlaX